MMKLNNMPIELLKKKAKAFKQAGYLSLYGALAIAILLAIKAGLSVASGLVTIDDGLTFATGIGASSMLVGGSGCCFALCAAANSELRLQEVIAQFHSGNETNKPRQEPAGNSNTSRTGTSNPKLAMEECP